MTAKRFFSVLLCLCLAVGAALPLFGVVASASSEGFSVSEERLVAGKGGELDYEWIDESNAVVEERESVSPSGAAASLRSASALPSKFDLRDSGRVSAAVLNQSTANSCWAFSSTEAIQSNLLTKNGTSEDYSESHLVWFSKNTRTSDLSDPTYGDGRTVVAPFAVGGNWLEVTASLARGSGLELESNAPFTFPTSTMTFTDAQRYASKTRLVSAEKLSGIPSEVKQKIIDKGAVMVSFNITNNTYNAFSCEENGVTLAGRAYYTSTAYSVDHAVTLVGWDDSFPVSRFSASAVPPANGAWLCKNSYGSTWGNGGEGYFWISYYDATLSNFISYDVELRFDGDRFESIYQYDAAGYSSRLGSDEAGASCVSSANIFTASQAGAIHSVSFYTMQSDVNCIIEIYKNVSSSASSPEDGALAVSYCAPLIEEIGYHTITLPEEVLVNKDERFSTVVVFTSETENPRAAFEGSEKNNPGVYTANTGESFYRLSRTPDDGTSWSDAINYHNAAIKAHAQQLDREYLSETIDAVDVEEYLPASRAALTAQLNSARGVLNNSDASGDDIVDAVLSLGSLVETLRRVKLETSAQTLWCPSASTAFSGVGELPAVITLFGSEEVPSTLHVSGDVTLTSQAPSVISCGSDEALLSISTSGSLTVETTGEASVAFDAGNVKRETPLIENSGVLTLGDGVFVRNVPKFDASFGPIDYTVGGAVGNSGTLLLDGVEFSGTNGCAVYNTGSLTLSGDTLVQRDQSIWHGSSGSFTVVENIIYAALGGTISVSGLLSQELAACIETPNYAPYPALVTGDIALNSTRLELCDSDYFINRQGYVLKHGAFELSDSSELRLIHSGSGFSSALYLTGFSENICTVDAVKAQIVNSSAVKVYNADGYEITGNARVSTGCRVAVVDIVTQTVLGEATALIFGDVNSDGIVDSGDATLVNRVAAMLISLSGCVADAADVNGDAFVDSGDATAVNRAAAMISVVNQLEAGDSFRVVASTRVSANEILETNENVGEVFAAEASEASEASETTDSDRSSFEKIIDLLLELLERLIHLLMGVELY